MRPARELESAPAASHTPIYDLLYSEYLRAFRALPGDRTGEEDLGFTAFSYGGSYTGGHAGPYPGAGTYAGTYGSGYGGSHGSAYGGSHAAAQGSGWNGSSWQQADAWQPAHAPQQPQPQYSYAGSGSGYAGGRQHQTGMQHIPAALPPAPRRGY
ncbi:hypothetical protein [Streptomyces sp. NBC_00503]|uniref:hypothetical protein n=1 Tax=Streptomyces sp. NBC_00503 TaxID=2903659 RepID=UPI002E81489A|nr:hypothetical protein [Streptomyces sp. NBC_00503]WUD80570.1 hypothetical protein OG490_08405 [Streptomyces sp. NBC_00503]